MKPKITGQAPVCTFTVTFAAGVFLFVFGGQSLHDNNLTNELYCLDTVRCDMERKIKEQERKRKREKERERVREMR